MKRPYVLIIIDGFGVDMPSSSNAVSLADKYNLDNYVSGYFATSLYASSEFVGLPFNTPGNSEIGHLNIGAGKIVYQDLQKINKSIKDKSFFVNQYFLDAILSAKKKRKNLHLVGTLSFSPANSLVEHFNSLIELIKSESFDNFYIHIILDGKDFDNTAGVNIVKDLQDKLNIFGSGKIASICGRYYGMDRDYNWDRTKEAYEAIVSGKVEDKNYITDVVKYVEESYKNNLFDDKILPAVVIGKDKKPIATIDDNDSVIFFNFKPDRIRQLAKSIIKNDFDEFKKEETLDNVFFVTMTEYENDLTSNVAFLDETVNESIVSLISDAGLTQLHISETEKYPHITYFLNGQKDLVYKGEERVLIPSINVKDVKDLKPEMSLFKVVSEIVDDIDEKQHDFIVCNLVNCEVLAHSGNLKKTIKAVESVDRGIGEIVDSVLHNDGVVFITSDHGNAEKMINDNKEHRDHTLNPVPFIIIGKEFENFNKNGIDKKTFSSFNLLSSNEPTGVLADVTPTILKIMGIKKVDEMTGRELI